MFYRRFTPILYFQNKKTAMVEIFFHCAIMETFGSDSVIDGFQKQNVLLQGVLVGTEVVLADGKIHISQLFHVGIHALVFEKGQQVGTVVFSEFFIKVPAVQNLLKFSGSGDNVSLHFGRETAGAERAAKFRFVHSFPLSVMPLPPPITGRI